jgi:hypothetical protein
MKLLSFSSAFDATSARMLNPTTNGYSVFFPFGSNISLVFSALHLAWLP